MAVFPSTPVPRIQGTSGSKKYNIITSKFENGQSQTRRASKLGKRKWVLSYNAITNAEYDALALFFDQNVGGNFDFTDPQTSVTYTVRFAIDEIGYKLASPARKNCDITIEEV